MIQRKSLILLLLLCMALPLCAENTEHRSATPHMLRVGWGDQQFEYLAFRATPQPINTQPTTYHAMYDEHFRYSQHWFVEYQNRVNGWFSYGGLLDGSGVVWDKVTRNGAGNEIARDRNHSVYNIVIMPTVYFTYLYHRYVSLYSGLGAGIDINGGTEKDYLGRNTVVAPALNITALGMSVGDKGWYASVELGTLMALTGGQHIYLFGSRVFSLSVGTTF